jgi:NitT/TauT family transport system ATP-binding protein
MTHDPGGAAMLEVQNLSKSYGQGDTATTAIGDVSFTIEQGSFTCLVGPSGCGKTTLLRCLSGLLEPTSGTVRFDGQVVNGPPEKMAFVFQDYSRSLMPWMTVRSNVELPLRYRNMDKQERAAVTDEALAAVRLTAAAEKYPWQLSGGMQQRVAIARALAYRPEVLLMDEPFASVDAQTRSELEDLMLDLWSSYGMTVLLVTHDIDEAVYLADRVLALSTSPSRVTGEFAIDLPRPRNQIDTKDLSSFAHLRTAVLKLIQSAASKADDGLRSPVEVAGRS